MKLHLPMTVCEWKGLFNSPLGVSLELELFSAAILARFYFLLLCFACLSHLQSQNIDLIGHLSHFQAGLEV